MTFNDTATPKNDTSGITAPTAPMLAADRHGITRLYQELQKNANPQKLKRYQDWLARSAKAVAYRQSLLPNVSTNPDLPVSQAADTLIKLIKEHQVIVVAGETGSGKTTQLPKLCLMAGRGITGQIGHTQPRRIAARSVANRISEELGESLGQTVSYKVRFEESGNKDSLIKLMTDGILLNEMAKDPYLTAYDTIIIDEAHERSLNIDFIMGCLKRLLPKRPDLKVIITSATLDTQRFAEYFTFGDKVPPICVVEGRSYPVEIRYRPLVQENATNDDNLAFDGDSFVDCEADREEHLARALVEAVNECVQDSQQKGVLGDILVFCATESQIKELHEVLVRHAPAHTQILMLFARQSVSEQNQIFTKSVGRRIILSTNVAETALTVPNIRYVIDLGLARISRYSYRSRVQRLPIEAISQSAANQRAGRCGRLSDGVCIRLYSEADFLARPQYTEPEILRTNLASVILQMAYLRLGDVERFDFITAPDPRLINDGKKLLHELGAVSVTKTALKKRSTLVLNAVGTNMAKMPIDPRLARMLIASSEFDCVADMLIIVSALAVQDIRERPEAKQVQADQKHALFRADNSDFLFYVNAFHALFAEHELNDYKPLSGNARKAFAKKHFLSYPRIREWQKTHSQLSQMMSAMGIDVAKPPQIFTTTMPAAKARLGKKSGKPTHGLPKEALKHDKQAVHYANLHRALLTALLSFVARKGEVKGEYLLAKNQKGYVFPASVLHKKGAEWVMAFEVVETARVYLRVCAKIEPSWILAAAKDLLKYHYFEPHWSKKTGRVRAYAQISLFGLIVAAKELVNFESIDPVQARQIFMMDALVAGELGGKFEFLEHNLAKMAAVNEEENRLRRRDLLVDEASLYRFYDERLPADILSRQALMEFVSDQKAQASLYFDDDDVRTPNVGSNAQDFPSHWQMGATKLPLSYVFDPSREDDGVSIKVPVSALPQMSEKALAWGVRGFRFELVVGLLKTLPKDIRRLIVPIPDTAQAFLPKLDEKKDLIDELARLLGYVGIGVSPSDFDWNAVDNYLKPLVCVINHKGQVIDQDRDLQKLQLKHQSQAPKAQQVGKHTDFPKQFCFLVQKKVVGVQVQEFQVLCPDDVGQAVNVVCMSHLSQALTTHKKGVLTLIKASLGARQKQLTGQITKALKMAFAPLGDMEKLKNLLIDASLIWAFDRYVSPKSQSFAIDLQLLTPSEQALLAKLPFDAQSFEKTKQEVLAQFLSAGQELLCIFDGIYGAWQTVRGRLLMLDMEHCADNIADIEDQLDDLALDSFVYRTDSTRWEDYGRYLQALNVRLERLVHNVEADSAGVYELDEAMERLAKVRFDPKYDDYRWAVEEYRIRLFAQPMKTKYPISQKRLQKIWQELA